MSGFQKRHVLLPAALLPVLLSGCITDCERWESRTVYVQSCTRWSGSHCASYSSGTRTQDVCVQRKGGSGASSSTSTSSEGIFESPHEKAQKRKRDYPLHSAASHSEIEKVKQLLDAGADPNQLDKEISTALHYAAVKGRPDVVRLLIARGAKVNIKNVNDHTPLDWAEITRKKSGTHYSESTPVGRQKLKEHDSVIEVLRANGAKNGRTLR